MPMGIACAVDHDFRMRAAFPRSLDHLARVPRDARELPSVYPGPGVAPEDQDG
jgi:hypothetical protein